MPPDQYEKQHLRNLFLKELEIRKQYEQAIHEISVGYSQITFNGEVFRLKDYPALLNKIKSIINKLHAKIYTAIVNGIEESWLLSFEKNNNLVDKRLAGKDPTKEGLKILYDPNYAALKEFTNRTHKGLNLSDRVWNTLDNYTTEMEQALGVGISEGRSAVEMASDLKKYLKEPDKLFRKVRSIKGDHTSKLKLSKAALNYETEPGVYKSSFANARRLAATEQNMAYRKADSERWKQLPFVKAIKIQVSNNHPKFDQCDAFAGIWPKDFVFTGWHPLCRCFAVAVQISDEEYDKFEDAILAGEGIEIEVDYVKAIPERAKKWIEANAERINGWSSKPYWVTDNKKVTAPLLK